MKTVRDNYIRAKGYRWTPCFFACSCGQPYENYDKIRVATRGRLQLNIIVMGYKQKFEVMRDRMTKNKKMAGEKYARLYSNKWNAVGDEARDTFHEETKRNDKCKRKRAYICARERWA